MRRSILLREHLGSLCDGDHDLIEERLSSLNAQIRHSVQLIDTPEISPMDSQNCVMYAFDLQLNPAYEPDGRYYARTAYVQRLISDGYLIHSGSTPRAGLIAVYAHGILVRHLGIVTMHGRIISKWGAGCVYSHQPFEVPLGYGETITYFHPIAKKIAYRELRHW